MAARYAQSSRCRVIAFDRLIGLYVSQLGQERRFDRLPMTSGLASATDLGEMRERVRLVPTSDIVSRPHKITRWFRPHVAAAMLEL